MDPSNNRDGFVTVFTVVDEKRMLKTALRYLL